MSRVSARSGVYTAAGPSFMGSLLCKQRRGPTPARAQRRKKLLQRRDCLLRAPCMLCCLVREPAVSEPVPPAPQDCAHVLPTSSWQERSSSVTSQEPGPDTLLLDMVCKRKNCGENQQPGTPCKQPRCAPAQDLTPSDPPDPCTEEHSSPAGQPTCASEATCQVCCLPSPASSSQDPPQSVREADPDPHKVEDEPLHINQLPPSLLLKVRSCVPWITVPLVQSV